MRRHDALAGSAVSALVFGWGKSGSIRTSNATFVIAAGCALSFFNLGAWGVPA